MAVDLSKFTGLPRQGASGEAGDPIDRFRQLIASRVHPDYCDVSERESFIRDGMSLGLDRSTAEVSFDLELEARCIASEQVLLQSLEALLRRFTDQDKKLDKKERQDAIQITCRPAAGYRQGLRYDVAERFLVQFCRSNGVKVKAGFLKWVVP